MPVPTPKADETQDEFVGRCHSALAGEFVDTDQRNAVCFRQWRESNGEAAEEKKAKERFPPDQFVRIRDIPIFSEHKVKENGHEEIYDKDALRKIVANLNRRIRDTGDFVAATIGHTPSRQDAAKGAKQPPVVGFYGPFRLGMIGNERPRHAIFADEFVRRDKIGLVRDHPRRSVEVWLEEKMEDRYFDPIAHLGAETPKLDLGLRFMREGKEVAKYAAAAPAAANVFVPQEERRMAMPDDDDDKEKMQGGSPDPAIVQAVVDAVRALPEFEFLRQQMEAAEAEVVPEEEAEPMMEAPEEKKPEVTISLKKTRTETDKPGGVSRETYARLQREHNDLKDRVAKIEGDKVRAQRYAKLEKLRYEGYVLEPSEDIKDCADMTAAQFDRHCERIVRYYQKAELGLVLPTPLLEAAEDAAKRAEYAQKARDLVLQRRDKGEKVTYKEALEEVRKGA